MLVIGICGGSASGKTKMISLLKEQYENQIAVIDMDNYYHSRDELTYDERKLVNYDIPESLDIEKIVDDINKLKHGEAIYQPFFSFLTYKREEKTFYTEPKEILIIDGIFSLYFEELKNLYDLKVFLDVDADVRLARRILRNMELYKRSAEFEIEQYFDKVRPNYEKYVEPCKKMADLVLPFYENEKDSLEPIIEFIDRKLV